MPVTERAVGLAAAAADEPAEVPAAMTKGTGESQEARGCEREVAVRCEREVAGSERVCERWRL